MSVTKPQQPMRTESDSMGRIEVADQRLLGRADGALAAAFQYWARHDVTGD